MRTGARFALRTRVKLRGVDPAIWMDRTAVDLLDRPRFGRGRITSERQRQGLAVPPVKDRGPDLVAMQQAVAAS